MPFMKKIYFYYTWLMIITFSFSACQKDGLNNIANSKMSFSQDFPSNISAKIEGQANVFYYCFDEKIPLNINSKSLIIKLDKEKETDVKGKILKRDRNNKYKEIAENILKLDILDNENYNDIKKELYVNDNIASCEPIYMNGNMELGVTNEILAQFLPTISNYKQIEVLNKFAISKVENLNTYLLLNVKMGMNTLEIANKMFETGMFKFCYPNFITKPIFFQLPPNDTYFPYQIALHNTGQIIPNENHVGSIDADIDALEAWAITQGNPNIIVAVIDQGVTSDHPDLPNTRQIRLNGSNFGTGNPNDPSPTGNDNHGNACAGVIGASINNNEGIVGIAPNCRIMPINIGSSFTESQVIDAINFAVDNNAHIISNSYGWPSDNPNLFPGIVTSIQNAINKNRVVVFAAGNNYFDNSTMVHFPANVNIPYVLTVGASDRFDNRAIYSPTSPLIDIVAPSHRAYPHQVNNESLEMWSLDIPYGNGYNPWPSNNYSIPMYGEILPNSGVNHLSYTARFGGTSHSCPLVAGVAALLLSIKSDLSNQAIFKILTQTCDKVGPYVYVNGKCNQMGFGRLNAYQAVLQANTLGNPITCNVAVDDDPRLCGWGNALTKSVFFNTPDLRIGSKLYYDQFLTAPLSGYRYIRFYSLYYPNHIFRIDLDGTFLGAEVHGCQ